MRVFFDLYKPEGAIESLIGHEATDGGMAEVCQNFDRFHGLEASDYAWEHAQDTRFASGGDGAVGRWLGEEAAVAGAFAMSGEDGDLTIKLIDRAMDEGLAFEVGGIVRGEAGGKVIGAVEDEIVLADEFAGVLSLEKTGM